MVKVNTSLSFAIEQQSLWRPGRAEELRIDSGDFLIWDPAEISKEFDVEVLGFGLAAEAYLDVRFGLLAYADLGTGGDWSATYDIDVEVTHPAAVFAGDQILFEFSDPEVVASTLETLGFGTSRISGNEKIGAGLDLIIDIEAGMRDIVFEHWFGSEGPASFKLIDLDERIELIGVNLEDPEITIDFSDEVSLTARLPTGANISAQGSDAFIEGSGASDTRFLELNADVDALLIKLLSKMPPPVAAVAKTLGDTVFAEHNFDISDYISFIGKGKFFFDFTLLDVGAGAGLVVTEDASLDITKAGSSDDLDITVTLTSDNGTADYTGDDMQVASGYLGDDLSFDAPTTGFGTATITADYQINRASFFHGLGVGLNASLTIDALSGALGGSWVPSALQFSFGPLLEIEFPDGGFALDLGNFYTDTFEVDASEFNIESRDYEVFYVEQALAPTNWNPNNPDAVAEVYKNFQIYFENLEASQNDPNYAGLGYNMQPTGSPVSAPNFSGQSNILYTWTGSITQNVTLGTNNGSLGKVDTRATTGDNMTARLDNGTFVGNFANSAQAQFDLLLQLASGASTVSYQSAGQSVTFDTSADVYGGDGFDLLVVFGDDTRFIDGGDDIDQLVADFTQLIGNTAVQWDLTQSRIDETDSDPNTVGGITLFAGTSSELVIKNVEGVSLKTGDGDDYFKTYAFQDALLTGGGNDFVELYRDQYDDFVALGDGDDAAFAGFFSNATIDTTDRILGGLGDDKVFIQLGNEGLRYNVANSTFGVITDQFNGFGIGSDANFGQLQEFLDHFYLERSYIADGNGNFAEAAISFNEYQYAHVTFSNGSNDSNIKIASDVERISVSASDGGGQGDDLVVYMGGSEYTAGAGSDTLLADFGLEQSYFGANGGVKIKLSNSQVDGFFGDTVFDGFERLHVRGTSASDEFVGGLLSDYISGGRGADILYGGDDSAADIIYGGSGSDRMFWANDGADLIEGFENYDDFGLTEDEWEAFPTQAVSRDVLDIVADGTESNGLRYRFATDYSITGGDPTTINYSALEIVSGLDDIWAEDGTDNMLAALAFATNENGDDAVYTNVTMSGTTYMGFRDIEVVNLDLSDAYSDVMMYQGGNSYIGGESANDEDVFVADLTHIGSPMDIQIKDDEATDGSDGYLIANQIYVEGLDRLILRAGSGNDVLKGGRYDDYIDGGEGNDQIIATAGNDIIFGGLGEDLIMWGNEGNATISGGPAIGNYGENDHLMIGARDGTAGSEISLLSDFHGVLGQVLTANSTNSEINSTLANLYNAPQAPGSDPALDFSVDSMSYDAGLYQVDYEDFQSVDIAASDDFDDVVLYQEGLAYYGGERANDADLFIGDFTRDAANGYDNGVVYGDLTFIADTGDGAVQDVGAGIKMAGFERFHLTLTVGDDIVIGGDLDDYVFGNDGNDFFYGGDGNDYFWGGEGNDTFVHTGGNDFFYGQTGNNIVSLSTLNRGNLVLNLTEYDLGTGIETPVVINAGTTVYTYQDYVNLDFTLENLYASSQFQGAIKFEYGANSLEMSGAKEISLVGGDLNDVLLAAGQTGSLVGGGGSDILISSGGDNFLVGGAGADTYVFAGVLDDHVIFDERAANTKLVFTDAAQADAAFSFEGTDLIINIATTQTTIRVVGYFDNSESGRNFTFQFSDFDGKIDLSGLGASTNVTGDVFNEINGTDDNDTLAYASHLSDLMMLGTGDDFVLSSIGEDLINGGVGSDGVSYVNSDEAVQVYLGSTNSSGGTAEGDVLVSIENIAGSLFDDVIGGSQADNNLNGGAGADQVYGGDGDDVVTGDTGNDTLSGGEGFDTLYGDEGKDTLDGGYKADVLFGGGGQDLLKGGAGADLLSDGLGNDVSKGGQGNDLFYYEAGNDVWDGGTGDDWADFSILQNSITVDLNASGDVMRTKNNGTLTKIVDLTKFENIRGSLVDDDLSGDAGDNVLNGSLGADILTGHAGDDILIGDAGLDTVDYSRETGGQGIDLVLNAIDYDQFGEEFLEGTDTHGDTDKLVGVEQINGTDFNDNIQTLFVDSVVYGYKGADFISGQTGNDILVGGGGDDNLSGGFGNDYLVGGNGYDVVKGGAGSDMVVANKNEIGNSYDGEGGVDDGVEGDIDTVNYSAMTVNLRIEMFDASLGEFTSSNGSATIDQSGNDDTLLNFEHFIMGQGNDLFIGYDQNEMVSYVGGLDAYDGGLGDDLVSFELFDAAVEVNLLNFLARTMDQDNVVSGTFREITSLVNFEDVTGSAYDDFLTGNSANNILRGGAGNDLLDGRDGDDLILAGDGDDMIISRPSTGVDTIDGGLGTDFLEARTFGTGVTLSLINGDGDDIITNVEGLIGTVFDDYLIGDAGNNVFKGLGGNDGIQAADGDDLIIYNSGYLILDAGAGSDTIDFSELAGGVRITTDDAFETNTVLDGDFDGTEAWEGRGQFHLNTLENVIGTDFADIITGSSDANAFNGGLGNDVILGKGGDDNFTYGGGLDDWKGGTGSDTANFSTFQFAVFVDLAATGFNAQHASGADLSSGTFVDMVEMTNFENIVGSIFNDVLNGDEQDNIISGFFGDDALLGLDGNDVIDGGDGNDLIVGGDGDDMLIGGTFETDGDDVIKGGKGFDTIIGGYGDDMLFGGNGADIVEGGEGNDTLNGGEGTDTLDGGQGDDIFSGGNGADILNGGSGNDTLEGDDGNDTLNGGAGFDILDGGDGDDILNAGDSSDVLLGSAGADQMNGDAGTDTVNYEASIDAITVDLGTGTGLGGDAEGDTFTSIERVVGSANGDTIEGTIAAEIFEGGAGADTLRSGGGDDWLVGGNGADLIIAGNGDDSLDGGNGADTLRGQAGSDQISGGAGNDTIEAGADNDFAMGGDGDDIIEGGDGEDLLKGDGDNDTLSGDAGNDELQGGDGADILNGGDDHDLLDGGQGVDTLNGDAGQDLLLGQNGNDTLNGGNGNDRLVGGNGNDTLTGGNGIDVFVYATDGSDTITDFEDDVDNIEFLGGSLAGAIEQNGNVILDLGGGNVLTVENMTIADLNDDMIF